MFDVFEVADVIVGDVRRRFPDTVAIVAYYGSYANGTATPRSDLDFFFIPDGPGAAAASRQFIIDGIGFDFWPISWERAGRIASFDEAIVSVVADCRVLYSRSQADLDRFEGLRRNIQSMSLPENRELMLGKAVALHKDCFFDLHETDLASRRDDLSATRRSAARLVSTTAQCLALANQTYFKRGMGQNRAELAALSLKPTGLEHLLDVVSGSADCREIHGACEDLAGRTRALLEEEQARLSKRCSFGDAFGGFHEEALSTYNKIRTACARGDRETAFYASISLQREVESAFEACDGKGSYARSGLPDLAANLDAGNLPALEKTVIEMEAQFREILKSRDVTLNEFTSLEEFKESVVRAGTRRTSCRSKSGDRTPGTAP